MKTLLLTLIMLLLIAVPCSAIDLEQVNLDLQDVAVKPIEDKTQTMGWNKWDTVLLVLRVVDWGQTREIATATKPIYQAYFDPNLPLKYYLVQIGEEYLYCETNPILGKHPSIEHVDTYFIMLIGIDILIANYSNPQFKKWWQYIGIICESYYVYNNFRLDIKMKF
jgi:hypothetical protein